MWNLTFLKVVLHIQKKIIILLVTTNVSLFANFQNLVIENNNKIRFILKKKTLPQILKEFHIHF